MRKQNRLYYLKKDIEQIQKELKDLPLLKASAIESMPSGKGNSSPVEQAVIQIEKLTEKLSKKLKEYVKEREKIEKFIDDIPDYDVRVIARMRLIDNLGWYEIGEKLCMEQSTARKKLDRYIESQEEKL